MNCLLCNQEMTTECATCKIFYWASFTSNTSCFWFEETIDGKCYLVKYLIKNNIMSVYHNPADTRKDLEFLFEVKYSKPILTPQNIKEKLPILITFS